jgi:hypothetical protein
MIKRTAVKVKIATAAAFLHTENVLQSNSLEALNNAQQ